MFSLFKRAAQSPQKPVAKPPPPRSLTLTQAATLPEAVDLPAVQEGNANSDWALWENSVQQMDSQLQGLTPSARIYERVKEAPSEYQDLDPFSNVNKNSP